MSKKILKSDKPKELKKFLEKVNFLQYLFYCKIKIISVQTYYSLPTLSPLFSFYHILNQIKIEAERGNGFQGDTAIDDIIVKDGVCSGIKPTKKPKEATGKYFSLKYCLKI